MHQLTGAVPGGTHASPGMVRISMRWTVLSSEQRIWDDIERFHTTGTEEPVLPGPHPPRRRDGRGVDDPPVAVVAGTWSAILLDLFGPVDPPHRCPAVSRRRRERRCGRGRR